MTERNPIQWPEKFGIGIRYKVLRLSFCLEKLDEKIAYLVRATKAYKDDAAFSSSMIELVLMKMDLEAVKKGIGEFLMQYRDACEQNKEEEEEEEGDDDDRVMEELKDFIIKVDKIKRVIDMKIRGLDNEEESSQDFLTAKYGGEGEDHDPKRKGLMIDDPAGVAVMKSHERGESSQARSLTERKK